MHTLLSKANPLCLHTILAYVADTTKESDKSPKSIEHKINFKGTVEKVIKNIQANFPASFRSCEEGEFLATSKRFVDKILKSDVELNKSLQCVPDKCDTCFCTLEEWKSKSPRSYLITLGKLSIF